MTAEDPELSDRAVLWVVLLTGLIPCIGALREGAAWGAEPSLGLLLVGLALLGLLQGS